MTTTIQVSRETLEVLRIILFTGESVKEGCDAGFPKPARKCPPLVGLSLFERVIQPSAGGLAKVLTVYTERRV